MLIAAELFGESLEVNRSAAMPWTGSTSDIPASLVWIFTQHDLSLDDGRIAKV